MERAGMRMFHNFEGTLSLFAATQILYRTH